MKKKFTIETKMVAQVRFFEELHCVRDERGEMIFTGSKELAVKILKWLKSGKGPK